jgi:hypothetical protein
MARLLEVPWVECLSALRRAGFVKSAESPASVVLVGAGRSLLLRRVPVVDERTLHVALSAVGISREQFLELLASEESLATSTPE